MKQHEQQRKPKVNREVASREWDVLVDELFALDAEHPYLGQTIEEPPPLPPRKSKPLVLVPKG